MQYQHLDGWSVVIDPYLQLTDSKHQIVNAVYNVTAMNVIILGIQGLLK